MTPLHENDESPRIAIRSDRIRSIRIWFRLGLLFVCTVPMGCASLQDCQYEHGQRFRGLIEYHRCADSSRSAYPRDYRHGWLDGYYEVITGGPDSPPAIAPQRYWNPRQVLKNRDQRRGAYYSGWQDGAARAACAPDTHYLKVFESPECPFPRCDCEPGGCQCGVAGVSTAYESTVVMESAGGPPSFDMLTVPSDSVLTAPNVDGGTSFQLSH